MRLNSALTFIFLFVSAALSGPLREKDQSWVPNLVKKSTNGIVDGVFQNVVFTGAYWEETNGDFTFATATFNVPAQSSQQSYATWVGIDGIHHPDSWLFAGIRVDVADNGETTYKAWCSWGFLGVPYLSNVAITPHDAIRISITARSATSSAVIFENLNNGQGDVHYLLVNATQSLVGREVSWGVLHYYQPEFNDTIPFETLIITNATAYGPSGRNYEAEGANKIEIKQGNKVVTSVETKGSTITIQHVHE